MVVAVAGSQAAVHNNRPQPTKVKTTNLAPQPPQFLRQKSTLQRALAPDALPHQERVRQLYVSDRVQKIIAVIIMLNFFGNMIEKEIDPPMGEEYKSYWQVIEDAFNYVFRTRARDGSVHASCTRATAHARQASHKAPVCNRAAGTPHPRLGRGSLI